MVQGYGEPGDLGHKTRPRCANTMLSGVYPGHASGEVPEEAPMGVLGPQI